MLSISRLVKPLAVAGALAMAATAAAAGPAVTPLVSADWLQQHVADQDVRVLDLRAPAGFEAGHVPGALRVDFPGGWRVERNGIPGMLPDVPDLAAYVSSLGIGPQTSVVVLPVGQNSADLGAATSIYFILKYLGHDAVAILDGGAPAWAAAANAPKQTGAAAPPQQAAFVANARPEILATLDEVKASLGTATALVDARSPAEYSGQVLNISDTRAGHVPGATNIPNDSLYDSDTNRLKPAATLAALMPAQIKNAASIIAYCNTGHLGSIDWFVLTQILGLDHVMLYDGSMAEWSRSDLPVVTGASG
jgi:thiosulfate/3-mercaptopyruvate sulfurtransferase